MNADYTKFYVSIAAELDDVTDAVNHCLEVKMDCRWPQSENQSIPLDILLVDNFPFTFHKVSKSNPNKTEESLVDNNANQDFWNCLDHNCTAS